MFAEVTEDNGIVRWPVPEDLTAAPEVAYRNRFAGDLCNRPLDRLVESYVYLSTRQMEQMARLAFRHLRVEPFRGVGIELGAGCGLLSATIAKAVGVDRIYALEVCEVMAQRVIPKVAAGVLGDKKDKIVPVVGSFNDIRLPDASVDFAIEIDSLHHSGDLKTTLRECGRVLKPGAQLLCFDRVHPDTVTDDEVERMLSQVYSKEFLLGNCYPPDVTLTRRENGEHEYRFFEWRAAFESASLRLVRMRPFVFHYRAALALKGMLSLLPRNLTRAAYKTENASLRTTFDWLKTPFVNLFVRHDFGRPVPAPRTTTVMLLEKAAG